MIVKRVPRKNLLDFEINEEENEESSCDDRHEKYGENENVSFEEFVLSSSLGNPRTPWLMLIPKPASKADVYVMNLRQNKRSYAVTGLGDKAANIIGCSKGWLVLMGGTANPDLFNPFTQTQIKLPLIEELKLEIREIEDNRRFVLSAKEVRELTEQGTVTVDNGNKVNGVVVRLRHSGILHWRRRDERWFSLNHGEMPYKVCHVVYEGNKLYVLDQDWFVEVWDFSNNKPERKRDKGLYGTHPRLPIVDMAMKKYLVRLGDRGFLVAVRFVKNSRGTEKTKSWELHKMIDGVVLGWECLQALEGYTVFLGENEPVVFLADKVSGYRGNTIHYSRNLSI